MLGYHRKEVRGENVAKIMPKCIGSYHDQFIRRYLETADSRFINKHNESFALRKNGFLLQVQIYATLLPVIEQDGLKFVGFLKRVDERLNTSILTPPTEYSI